MKRYLFDVRPDGSIAARYYFDCRDIPAQPLPADATRLAIEVTGEETPEAMALPSKFPCPPRRPKPDETLSV